MISYGTFDQYSFQTIVAYYRVLHRSFVPPLYGDFIFNLAQFRNLSIIFVSVCFILIRLMKPTRMALLFYLAK